MYITEVIDRTDALYPNEFTFNEKIRWLNELNAKLKIEYDKTYGEIVLAPDTDGTYLLPEWLDWNSVHSIRCRRTEIKKENFTTYGVKKLYGSDTNYYIETPTELTGDLTLIYLIPAKEIRVIDEGGVECQKTDNGFLSDIKFIAGDILRLAVNTNNDETNLLEVTVNVFSSEYNDTEAKWETECSGIENIDNSFFANIDRVITDKTVCDIPYDEMYIHWLCAKICYWQKNFAAYNQHMTSFNQLLSDYSHYIIERSPSTDDGKFVGWI